MHSVLPTTHKTSKMVIDLTTFEFIGLRNADVSTIMENKIKITPVAVKGLVISTPKTWAKVCGVLASSKPVAPELMPFTSKTLFSIISKYFRTKLKSTYTFDIINKRHGVVILRQNKSSLDIFYYI